VGRNSLKRKGDLTLHVLVPVPGRRNAASIFEFLTIFHGILYPDSLNKVTNNATAIVWRCGRTALHTAACSALAQATAFHSPAGLEYDLFSYLIFFPLFMSIINLNIYANVRLNRADLIWTITKTITLAGFAHRHPQPRSRLLCRFTSSRVKPTTTMASTHKLPPGFLSGPAPNLTRSSINFTQSGLPDFDGAWAVILDGVMTAEECSQLVAAAEATTNGKWERALVNIGGGMQAMYEDTRKCGRIIWDERALMEKLWNRISESVPEIHRLENWVDVTGPGPAKRKEVWKATRLNERARFLKYVGGEYFKRMYR
jgi:hypothetical protein